MSGPIAYNLTDAAAAVGVSLRVLQRAIAKGDLTRRYPTRKPVILYDDLLEWVNSLPVDSPK
jgi:hypothetical protein